MNTEQRVYDLKCPSCGHEFKAKSFTIFEVEWPHYVEEVRAHILMPTQIRAAPCPECFCGTPIENKTEWKWEKYENTSTRTT